MVNETRQQSPKPSSNIIRPPPLCFDGVWMVGGVHPKGLAGAIANVNRATRSTLNPPTELTILSFFSTTIEMRLRAQLYRDRCATWILILITEIVGQGYGLLSRTNLHSLCYEICSVCRRHGTNSSQFGMGGGPL